MARKALLIGINKHQISGADLRGCVNDVENMREMLNTKFGFAKSKIKTLKDLRATKKNIQSGIRELLSGAKAGDVLVLHYSGHGANVPDDNGHRDEADGLDEILCPTDLDWYDPLRDDWLRTQFDRVRDGVNLTVFMDCCHSGSNTRELRNPFSKDPLPRYLASPWELARGESGRRPRRRKKRRGRSSRTNVSAVDIGEVLITGCRDDQTSADAWIDGSFQGAMTSSLLKTIRGARAGSTYRQIHKKLVSRVRGAGYSQRPQLEGRSANLDRPFLAPLTD